MPSTKSVSTEPNITREKLLSSILTISRLLTRPVSMGTVLNAIVRETQEVFGLGRVAIFLINKDARLLEAKYLSPNFAPTDYQRIMTRPLHLDKHACRETLVVKTGKTVYINNPNNDPRITPVDLKMDLYWKRVSTISAPLRSKKEIIGVMEGDRHDKVLNLTRKEVSLFTYFANLASIIIENAKLQAQNQKKIDQLILLQVQSTRNSRAMFDRDHLRSVIAHDALELTKARRSCLYLVDEENASLVKVAEEGKPNRQRPCTRAESVVKRVAETKQPQLICDLGKEESLTGETPVQEKSQIAVPIMCEGTLLGVISVYGGEIGEFSSDDLEILSIMSGHAAVLIRNVNLYEQVLAERDRVENILESSPNGVVTINIGGHIQSINRKAEQILEVNRADILGKSIADISSTHLERIFNAAMHGVPCYGAVEMTLKKKIGDTAMLEITPTFVKSLNGRASGVILTIKDVTESKRKEEIIHRMDRYASLGQLSAGIAHEIRNPLASINFNIQSLSREFPLNDAQKRLFDDTMLCVDRIKVLVKNVLDFAKPTPPQFTRGRIEHVLNHCISLIDAQLRKKKITIHYSCNQCMPEIMFDGHQIEQVFINLFLNAMDSMPDGGDIIVSVSDCRDPLKDCNCIAVTIQDTGCGITPENLSKIFDPFFTTKKDGTGLGLSIVHKIMEQHGSLIEIASEPFQGTKVKLMFPTAD